jgi:small-conductance mechanosensitive channel
MRADVTASRRRTPVGPGVMVLTLLLALLPAVAFALGDAGRLSDAGGDAAADGAASALGETGSPAVATSSSAPSEEASSAPPSLQVPSALPASSQVPASNSAFAPMASASATASASPHAGDAEHTTSSIVHLHERDVFTVRAPLMGHSAEQRAGEASHALERIGEEKELPEVRVEQKGDVAIVFGGATPIIQLGAADTAEAGDASLDVHAASVAEKVRDALKGERNRKAIAQSVFSFSLLIFSGLIAVLLLGKVTELVDKMRAWVAAHPDRLPAVRVLSIDLIRPAAIRAGLSIGLGFGRILSQVGVVYAWLIFALSLFEATSGYTSRLTGFVVAPVSALVGRIGSALPLILITAFATVAVVILMRFVGLFFGSVARGETTLHWLPRDLATPTGVLVRLGIVVVSLLIAAPLVTGNDDGALSRAGVAALVALGVAIAPVLASAAVGIPVVYGRRLRVGDFAEIGGRLGRVLAIGLLDVRLEDDLGCEVRVPHLVSLVHPTRLLGRSPHVSVALVVDPTVPQGHIRGLLIDVARRFGSTSKVDLVRLDADGAHYQVTVANAIRSADGDLASAVADALCRENVALGRSPRTVLSA